MEEIKIAFRDPMAYDRLHTLSVEYGLTMEMLINVAVERLLEDVEFVRDLRAGRIKPIVKGGYPHPQNG